MARPTPPTAPTDLAQVPVHARATLRTPATMDGTVLRLLEMGMTAGTLVTVTRRAALGDPIEIAVRHTRLCLRKKDAACFPVDLVDDVTTGGGP